MKCPDPYILQGPTMFVREGSIHSHFSVLRGMNGLVILLLIIILNHEPSINPSSGNQFFHFPKKCSWQLF